MVRNLFLEVESPLQLWLRNSNTQTSAHRKLRGGRWKQFKRRASFICVPVMQTHYQQ